MTTVPQLPPYVYPYISHIKVLSLRFMTTLSVLFSPFINAVLVLSAPNLSQLKTDLTILADNNLNNEQTDAAILLGTPTSFETAETSCELLGEKLWAPTSHEVLAGLNNSLAYQVYLGVYPPDQLFWVASENSDSSQAIDIYGHIFEVSCNQQLPSLCTQSAPMSNATFASTATQFQITQQVGKQALTGYRDFYTWKFFGVRFAPEPERFTYSTVYDGVGNVSALEPGPACVQPGIAGSEDCLSLDIWTPFLPSPKATSKKKLKAVMLWIFGGGFTEGYATDPGTDGTNLASRGDVVVVNINYRLGNLGFLALDDGVMNGNYGIQDMITALQWVSANIEAFGGDPSRVTIFGESAGAAGVRALLASPKTRGLFAGAIMESTPVGFSVLGPYSNYSTIQYEFETVATPILNLTGCLNSTDQLQCLRSLDASTLADLPVIAYYPVIDGTYLQSPGLSFQDKTLANIPILLGTNRDEGGISAPYPASSNLTIALQTLSSLLGIDLTPLSSSPLFPLPNTPNTTQAMENFNLTSLIISLGGLRCLTEATAYSSALHSTFSSIYLYEFNRTYQPPSFTRDICQPPTSINFPNGDLNAEYYKCHAGEVNYVFGVVERQGLVDRDGLDGVFSRRVVDSWSAFARSGDPNPEGGYLEVRGFEGWGERWESVSVGGEGEGLKNFLWQIEGGMVELGEVEKCAALGLPLDYYEH